MRILLKYTLKSIGEKKFRSFLIIFAIALAGALFLTSSRLAANIGDMYMDLMKSAMGDVDICIYVGENSPSNYIDMSGCKVIKDQMAYMIPSSQSAGEYKEVGGKSNQIYIQGFNFDDFIKTHKIDIIEGSVENIDASYPIILSKNSAASLGLKVGDTLKLKIDKATKQVTLVAVAANTGFYTFEQGYIQGIMPFDVISKIQQSNGRPSEIDIKLNKGVDKQEAIKTLQKAYPKYEVQEAIDTEELNQELSSITNPFMLMTFIVIFMSMFIIYSSFKVIMLEKLPSIGTFRSVGASKPVMNAVLLLEAVFYGIIGGIGACILGKGCLYGLTTLMVQTMAGGGIPITMNIPPSVYIETFLLASVMAVLSTIIPILSVSKISLKDIILNNRPHKSRRYFRTTFLGIIIIAIGFTIPKFAPQGLAMGLSISGMFAVIIGVIMILPLFVLLTSQVLGVLFKVVFGNVGSLAAKNIKKNKSVLNSITLITIGISVLLMISTMTKNVSDQVLDFYKDTFCCDIRAYVGMLDDQRVRMVKKLDGVERVVKCIEPSIKLKQYGSLKIYPEVVDDTKLSPDINFNIENEEEMLTKLQEGRNIIINKALKKRYDIKIGDKIKIPFKKQDREYTVIGYVDTMWGDGNFAILPMKYYKRDAQTNYYDVIYVTAKEGVPAQQIADEIDKAADKAGVGSYSRTIEDMTIQNQQGNEAMMSLISIFAVLAMLIGVIGVINNLIISFIERKQNIAMLRSIGMSKRQVLGMIFIEGLGSGTIGAVGGIIGGVLICIVSNYIMEAMEMPIKVIVEPSLFLKYLIGGMLITVLGSVIPARGSSKMNIIEALKYE